MKLAPLLTLLKEQGLPHMLFVNKMDKATGSDQRVLDALQPVSNLGPINAMQQSSRITPRCLSKRRTNCLESQAAGNKHRNIHSMNTPVCSGLNP